MSQKLTLARYLEGRGSVKSLTRIEAEAFGVPYPLVSGWPARHGDMVISRAMLEDLAHRIGCARRSTASKALRGLDGVGCPSLPPKLSGHRPPCEQSLQPTEVALTGQAPSFPGFALRAPKRLRFTGTAR